MSRQNRDTVMENLLPGKIRKRVCSSPPSSSSSMIQNYRFKKAILVGRKRGGSTTPLPTWKLMMRSPSSASALRALESPKYAASGNGSKVKVQQQQQQPVSARKLAATLWEMNEIPSPGIREASEERKVRKERKEGRGGRERIARSVHSGSLPPHLSDPSYSPVSERMDRSGTGSRHRGALSISHRPRLTDNNIGVFDSVSNASLMEIETRSLAQAPTGSTVGVKTRLKDASNALTTSKELLKILNRMWGHEDRPSSSMSLISALHAELERARLQVNQLIQEQRSEQNDINYLMKCFAEEKSAWKNKEQKVVEAAIESIAADLDVERKLRRRFESLNKKLGKELAETKAFLLKAVKELESEKRARVLFEQVCNEMARSINEDKTEAELKKESAKVREEVEKEREMMQVADILREEGVQMKLSDAKYQLEEKNAGVDKLRSQLEAFLGSKRLKGKEYCSANEPSSEEIAAYLDRTHFGNEENEENGEVEDAAECEEDSADSDLHSIELNMDSDNKNQKWAYPLGAAHGSGFDEGEIKGRKSTSSIRLPRRKTSLQRSISDAVDWGMQSQKLQNSGDELDWTRLTNLERQAQENGCLDELQGYKSVKGLKEHLLSGSKLGSSRFSASPTRPPRDYGYAAQDRPPMVPGSPSKSRLADSRGEGHNVRKSRW
ncbi:hypothetical protein SLA2020_148020 [Shorea laevis]